MRTLLVMVIVSIGMVLFGCEVDVRQTTDEMSATTTEARTTATTLEDNGCLDHKRKIMRSPKLEYALMVCRLTGEDSINNTYTRFGFGNEDRFRVPGQMNGTDLGIP